MKNLFKYKKIGFRILEEKNKIVFGSINMIPKRYYKRSPIMMEELNNEINEESLYLAPSAGIRIKSLVEQDKSNSFLRVEVEGGGCSGFQYHFKLVPEDNYNDKEDLIFERDGGKLLCDKLSLTFLKGSKIEWKEELIKSAFHVVDNPNSEKACGCGTSFSIKMK